MTEMQDALATAMSVLLHEDADPDCTGEPSYFTTQEQARSLVDRAWQTPIVQNALASDAGSGGALDRTPAPTQAMYARLDALQREPERLAAAMRGCCREAGTLDHAQHVLDRLAAYDAEGEKKTYQQDVADGWGPVGYLGEK